MTLRELRQALRRMPANARVIVQAHDQGAGEMDSTIGSATLLDEGDPEYIGAVAEYGQGVPVVVLRS